MKALQQRLEEELRRCLRQIQAAGGIRTTEEADGTTTADLVDGIQARGIARNQLAVASRTAARAETLRAALERVKDGRYGLCVECGEPIGQARLRVMPEAATCVACQERLERSAGRRRVA